MLEEEDLDLFPNEVVVAFRSGGDGRMVARAKLGQVVAAQVNQERKCRQQYWVSQSELWGGATEAEGMAALKRRKKYDNMVIDFFLGPIRQWTLMLVLGAFGIWIWFGKSVGTALGSPGTGVIVAFWVGVVAVMWQLVRHTSGPGISRYAVMKIVGVSALGAGTFGVAKLLAGVAGAEFLALIGLILFVGPPAVALFYVAFEEPEG